jgi:hypothetical protein
VLTRLNGLDGVVSSSALLADDGRRMVQITIRPGANLTSVTQKVQSVLRAKVQSETPSLLESKSADAVQLKPDWLTLDQLNTIVATEEASSRRFDWGYWLLGLTVFVALGAFLVWFLRRSRSVRQRSEVRRAGV